MPRPRVYENPDLWRSPGRSAAERAREQDRAAGGRDNRIVVLPNGRTATASVSLKRLQGHTIWAYVRYYADGRTVARYIGPVTEQTRERALRAAWRTVLDRGLLPRESAGARS
jgi:DNA mismatch endonuclease (patch repair protein)